MQTIKAGKEKNQRERRERRTREGRYPDVRLETSPRKRPSRRRRDANKSNEKREKIGGKEETGKMQGIFKTVEQGTPQRGRLFHCYVVNSGGWIRENEIRCSKDGKGEEGKGLEG